MFTGYKKLSDILKTFPVGKHIEARAWAKENKKIIKNKSYFDIRFKIDSKNQRRIQCALPINLLFEEPMKLENVLDIKPITSKCRERNRK